MNISMDKTKIKHKKYGVGVFKGTDLISNKLCYKIYFDDFGEKKFSKECFANGLLEILSDPISTDEADELPNKLHDIETTIKQFDNSDNKIADENVLEAFISDYILIFNESYVVIGQTLKAKKISASYNLTVLGDLEADEIVVKGNLFVTGSIKANSIRCFNALTCQDEIGSKNIEIGSDLIAKSISCDKIQCDGNVFVRTTMNIGDSGDIHNVAFSGEGIIGVGTFTAKSAVAKEYFEFDGDISAHIVELDDDNEQVYDEIKTSPVNYDEMKPEELIDIATEKYHILYKNPNLTEDDLVRVSKILALSNLECFKNIDEVFNEIINISYQEKISDLYTYLKVIFAQTVLPKEYSEYETVSHVFSKLLPDAEKNILELKYTSDSVVDIAKSIYMIEYCKQELKISKNILYDRVFSSIGIKFNTVLSMLKKD